METILTAVISGLSIAIPTMLTTILANRKDNALVKYRIDELDAKVNKHNNLIERTFNIEKKLSVIEERILNLEERKK